MRRENFRLMIDDLRLSKSPLLGDWSRMRSLPALPLRQAGGSAFAMCVCRGMICLISIVYCLTSSAQDIHFSQFYASPLTLNPSLTGNFDGLMRFGANYRSQWGSVSVPFQTVSVYTDLNMLRDKMDGNWLSAGLHAVNDHAGDGKLMVNKAALSLAYHIKLTKWRNFYLNLGASGIYVHKKIDFSSLLFDSQWNDVGFDSSIDPAENYTGNSIHYFDLHAGASMTYSVLKKFSIEGGVSVIHIFAPVESYFNAENQVHRRPVAHVYSDIRIHKDWGIQPGAVFMYQRRAQELIAGANVTLDKKLTYSRKLTIFFGLWYRNRDALFPLVGAQLQRTRMLFNYDVNLSKLVPGSYTVGAFEISIVHVIDKARPVNPVRQCPRLF